MHPLLSLVAIATLGAAHAQFTDLQPGMNFPGVDVVATGGHTESVEFGDVDGDGDLDVILGNGGDQGNQPNRIYINQGGLQGGSEGDFVEETAARFAGIPDATTRDLDFADIDGDGDIDIVEGNRGSQLSGAPSRFYVNDGGAQGGTVGFFTEATDSAWGQLLSVSPTQQVLGGDTGPWNSWTCDCDFGDLDDDGDLDLFASSYGPTLFGGQPSRVFLNDGSGVFDEHAPWSDTSTTTDVVDVELVDLDGDFDIDIVLSSRGDQSRVFVNNTHEPLSGSTTLFTDTTQESLLDTQA